MKRPCTNNPTHTLLRSLTLISFGFALVSSASCSAVKFYPGEERADSTIGRLLFNATGADMKVVTIDGVPHPHPGRTVEILPGAHTLEIKYEENFESDDDQNSDTQDAENLMRFGSCSLRFTIEATQELLVYVDAGAHPVIGSSTPPTITLKEQGYYKPALFQERCSEEGRAAQPGKVE